jgi:hypothetical protein
MANPLKEKLADRLHALQQQRTEKAQRFQGELATLDAEIAAIVKLAQNWDTYTVDQALAALADAHIALDLKS